MCRFPKKLKSLYAIDLKEISRPLREGRPYLRGALDLVTVQVDGGGGQRRVTKVVADARELGQVSHSVLLTNLANTAQPLIRYQMGDQIMMHEQLCACGSPLPWVEVQGRHDDILWMQGTRNRSEVALLPLALSTVLEEQAGVFDFQIRQRDDHTLVLRLPDQGEAGKQALRRARTVLKAYALQQGVEALRVVGELGMEVPRGRSGKAHRIQAQRK